LLTEWVIAAGFIAGLVISILYYSVMYSTVLLYELYRYWKKTFPKVKKVKFIPLSEKIEVALLVVVANIGVLDAMFLFNLTFPDIALVWIIMAIILMVKFTSSAILTWLGK